MTVTQRSRGRVPLDQRSVISTVSGVPWWGALACAVIAITIGYMVDALAGTELTMFFSTMFLIGCLVAALVVQNKSIFTAMVQPPLLMIVSVPLAYKTFATGPTRGLKSLVLDMALPLIDRFPTMVITTLAVWIIGAFRLALYIQEKRGKASAGARRRKPLKASAPNGRAASRARVPAEAAAAAGVAAGSRQPGQARRAAAPTPSAQVRRPRAGDPTVAETARDTEQPRTRRRQAASSAPYGGGGTTQPAAQGSRYPERQPRAQRDDQPSTRAARRARYDAETQPAEQASQPRQPRQSRAAAGSGEPSIGRRRLQQQESVREFAQRQGSAPQQREPRSDSNPRPGPRAAGPRAATPRAAEPRTAEPRTSEPRAAETRRTDPLERDRAHRQRKSAAPRDHGQRDPGQRDPGQPDPGQWDRDSRGAAPRPDYPKLPNVRYRD